MLQKISRFANSERPYELLDIKHNLLSDWTTSLQDLPKTPADLRVVFLRPMQMWNISITCHMGTVPFWITKDTRAGMVKRSIAAHFGLDHSGLTLCYQRRNGTQKEIQDWWRIHLYNVQRIQLVADMNITLYNAKTGSGLTLSVDVTMCPELDVPDIRHQLDVPVTPTC